MSEYTQYQRDVWTAAVRTIDRLSRLCIETGLGRDSLKYNIDLVADDAASKVVTESRNGNTGEHDAFFAAFTPALISYIQHGGDVAHIRTLVDIEESLAGVL